MSTNIYLTNYLKNIDSNFLNEHTHHHHHHHRKVGISEEFLVLFRKRIDYKVDFLDETGTRVSSLFHKYTSVSLVVYFR